MKINFSKITVRGLVQMCGSIEYQQLVSLAAAHGIAAHDCFVELQNELEQGTISKYTPFGKPTLYQGDREKKARVRVPEDQIERIRKFVFKEYRERKFRAGTVAKDMNAADLRWHDEQGGEHEWTKERLAVALSSLAKDHTIVGGKPGPQGTWYWMPSLKEQR